MLCPLFLGCLKFLFFKLSSSGNYRYKLNGQLDSTKTDQKNHGKGLTNVREIVERNSGFCNITAEKDSFTVDIYIPLLTERGKSL